MPLHLVICRGFAVGFALQGLDVSEVAKGGWLKTIKESRKKGQELTLATEGEAYIFTFGK